MRAGHSRPGCTHTRPDLPYLVAHRDADMRLKRGERQLQCRVCLRWYWPDAWSHDGQTPTRIEEPEEKAP